MKNSNLDRLINGHKLALNEINELLSCVITSNNFRNTKSQTNDLKNKLSSREKEIALLISKGFKNKEISEKLNIAFETVKTHRKNITTVRVNLKRFLALLGMTGFWRNPPQLLLSP